VLPPFCHSERSEESNSSAGPGFYSTQPTPRVILSEAKNPGKEAPSTVVGILRFAQNDTGGGGSGGPCRARIDIPLRFAPPPSKGDIIGCPMRSLTLLTQVHWVH